MILLIDNYDSFVHNLARYFECLGQTTRVIRNDAIDVDGVLAMRPDAIVLSPGPCTPAEAGCSLRIVRNLVSQVPILGVCLGHQTIAQGLGGRVCRAAEPVHGRASEIIHGGWGIFAGLPSPQIVGRYHSLIVDRDSMPTCLKITASASDGTVMAVQHREQPVVGLQFHPESILTEYGYEILEGFLKVAGLRGRGRRPSIENERAIMAAPLPDLPPAPVTF